MSAKRERLAFRNVSAETTPRLTARLQARCLRSSATAVLPHLTALAPSVNKPLSRSLSMEGRQFLSALDIQRPYPAEVILNHERRNDEISSIPSFALSNGFGL